MSIVVLLTFVFLFSGKTKAQPGCTLSINFSPTDTTICSGTSITLNATASITTGTTYQWEVSSNNGFSWANANNDVPTGFTYTGSTTNSITVTASTFNTTSIVLRMYATNQCTVTSDNTKITVQEIPVPDLSDISLCEGESQTIRAQNGGQYKWNTSATSASITVSPANTTTYTVTVTTNGCSASDEAQVSIIKAPVSIIGDTICAGQIATINAGIGADSYTWNNSTSTSALIHVSPTTNTTYIVTISKNGCTATGSAIVLVTSAPTTSAMFTDSTINAGNDIILSVSGGNSYQWSTTETTASIHIQPFIQTTYTATVTSINGCTDDISIIINIIDNNAPISAGSSKTICEGKFTTLTATGGKSYIWSNSKSTQSISVSPIITTTYIVTITTSLGVTGTASTFVTVNKLPVANAGINQTICKGTSASLTATGGSSYLWNTGETNPILAILPNATIVYTVTVYSTTNCSASDVVQVTINPIPTVDAGSNQRLCNTLSIQLNATSNTTWKYNWIAEAPGQLSSNNINQPLASIDNSSILSNDTTITFNVFVTDTITTCIGKDSIEITFEHICKPRVSLTLEKKQLCSGESTQLETKAYWSDALVYVWSNPNLTGAGPFTITPTSTTTYFVTVTDKLIPSKSDKASIILTVNPLPSTNSSLQNRTICEGESSTFNAENTSYSFTWNTGSTAVNYTVNPKATSTYTVTISTTAGCTASNNVIVFVQKNPSISITTNDTTGCLPYTSIITVNSNPIGLIYYWQFNERTSIFKTTTTSNNYSYTYNNAGTYDIIVKTITADGCYSIDTLKNKITVNPKPTASFTYNPENPSIQKPFVNFYDKSSGNSIILKYLWNFDDPLSSNNIVLNDANPLHRFAESGIHHVSLQITNEHNCTDSLMVSISINTNHTFFAPTIFSPNNDGLNDYFKVTGTGIDLSTFKLQLFSRLGDLLFYTTDINNGWDGRKNGIGEILSNDAYTWMVQYHDLEGGPHTEYGVVIIK